MWARDLQTWIRIRVREVNQVAEGTGLPTADSLTLRTFVHPFNHALGPLAGKIPGDAGSC